MDRHGFAPIALSIGMVLIGLLASLAMLKCNTNENEYVAAMKSDLLNLMAAEEAHFADMTTYSTDKAAVGVSESAGVTITIDNAGGKGFSARAAHTGTAKTCTIYVGDGGGGATVGNEGAPTC